MQKPFYNPDQLAKKHGGELPHWQQGEVFYFLTWRLADSLPQGKLAYWQQKKTTWLMLHPKPWDEKTGEAYHALFSSYIDQWLDAGVGSCILKDARLAQAVAQTLTHFDGQQYLLDAFVVMPNHVHVLFQLLPDVRLEQVVKAWKGVSARKINQILGVSGTLWQSEYWDRMIRGKLHLNKCRKYIAQNPEKLRQGEYVLKKSEG